MPTRYKPSDWQPAGLEKLAGVARLYPPDVLNDILSKVPVSNPRKRAVLEKRVLDTVAWLNAELHYEERPTVPEKRVALDSVERPASNVLESLRNLDGDTAKLLADAANEDPQDIQSEPAPEQLGGYIGDVRVRRVETSIDNLLRWLGRVRQNLGSGTAGAPEKAALGRAVKELRDAWFEATGSEPKLAYKSSIRKTYGPFLDFVTKALTPVAGNVKFEAACRKALYR